MRVAILITPLLLVLAGSAAAQDGLQRCRALSDNAARLACYDSLANAARAMPTAAAGPAIAAPATASTAVAPAAAPRTGEAVFGLPESKRPDAVDAVESSVGPTFSGWGPNSRIRLANGQVWQVIDGSAVSLPEGSRKVSVKRGALASFYLDIQGLNTSPRVRRVD